MVAVAAGEAFARRGLADHAGRLSSPETCLLKNCISGEMAIFGKDGSMVLLRHSILCGQKARSGAASVLAVGGTKKSGRP
jgi:hypothetical protein